MLRNVTVALSALVFSTTTGVTVAQDRLAYSDPSTFASAPAMDSAGIGTLLLGCSGLSVEVADSSHPIPLGNSVVEASALVGMSCAEVLQILLDSGRISSADITASSHLVINNTPREGGDDDDTDVPDCIIWDIDTGYVTMQMVCDIRDTGRIEAQRSSTGSSTDLVGRPCADALDSLGGLPNVLRTSATRPTISTSQRFRRGTAQSSTIPGSLRLYQLQLYLP